MELTCMHCGKLFEEYNSKFCSQECNDSHIAALEKRTKDAVRDDPSYTNHLSED